MAFGTQCHAYLLHNGGKWTGRESEGKILDRESRPLEREMGGAELYNQPSSQEWGSLIFSILYLACGSSQMTGRWLKTNSHPPLLLTECHFASMEQSFAADRRYVDGSNLHGCH